MNAIYRDRLVTVIAKKENGLALIRSGKGEDYSTCAFVDLTILGGMLNKTTARIVGDYFDSREAGYSIGERIANRRYACGMTQDDLALATGINRRTIGSWETGQNMPNFDRLCELSAFLGYFRTL